MTLEDKIELIAISIIRVENAKPELNNPGNIMDLAYYKATGQFKLQQYETLLDGWNALKRLVGRYIERGYDLEQFFAKYAPSGHGTNNPQIYARTVSTWTGLPLLIPIKDI